MRLIATIILLPFVLAFSFCKALILAFRAFRLGMQGNTYCKHCGTPVHVDNSIFGFCSTECASFDNSALDNMTQESEATPEWTILQDESSAKLRDFSVFIDQNGSLYLEDFGADEPFLKAVGYDGYTL